MKNTLTKTILRLFLSYRGHLVFIAFFALLFIGVNILKPYILSLFFDVALVENSLSKVLTYTLYFFLIMAGTAGLSIANEYVFATFANDFVYKIRMMIIGHMTDLPIGFYDTQATGDILTRLDDDVTDIGDYLLYDVTAFYQAILGFIGAGIFIGVMQWRLLVANLVILPILAFVLHYFKKILYSISMQVKQTLSESNQELVDGFSHIKELKATNFGRHFLVSVAERFLALLNIQVKSSVIRKTSASTIQFVINLTFLVTIGYGGVLALQGLVTPGLLLAFLTMRARLVDPVRAWSNLYAKYFLVKAAVVRLNEYYTADVEPGLEIPPQDAPFPGHGDLALRALRFGYHPDRPPVLHNLGLTLPQGQWIGLKGASGSGKTTLLHLLLKLRQPTAGHIVYDGRPIGSVNNQQWRDQISYVSQAPLVLNKSIRDNVVMGRAGFSDSDVWNVLRVCALDEKVRAFSDQLDTRLGERGAQFSGGMIKRLMLSRVLLEPRPLLLLDECFSGLDSQTSSVIWTRLRDYLPPETTAVIISHRMTDFDVCDLVYDLDTVQPSPPSSEPPPLHEHATPAVS